MATVDPKEYKDLTVDDLTAELDGTEQRLVQLRFDHSTRGVDNPLEIRTLRRNVAKLKTELRAREVADLSDEELAKRTNIKARRAGK
ncbi:50S ribosomal protein L29 [Membranihabitans maritimus]|uniref:50S ribosomal protein L29 n=1 Tax=Membranihabitans maritimus TaxID=2904244 RepID=UPI001EFFB053|nr:50S ribosomal protein L29 [Membranihabitans maritimus]